MSVRQMGLVWELDLPKPLKFLLLAMADHADHDGGNVYPGVELLAWKTGDHPRTVQRSLRRLESLGLIEIEEPGGGVVDGGVRGRATVYRLTLENGGKLSPFQSQAVRNPGTTVLGTPAPAREEPRHHGARNPGTSATPTVIEPSTEPSVEPFPALRAGEPEAIVAETSETETLPATAPRRDLVFEAVAAVCFGADDWSQLTSKERGMANRACKELRAVNATPADVAERAAHFVAWVGQRPTPDNLVTHWNRLREPVQKLHRDDLEAFADAERMRRIVADGEATERQRAAHAAEQSTVTVDRQLDTGHPPPGSPSAQHPRQEGESMRDYIRRVNALTREVG